MMFVFKRVQPVIKHSQEAQAIIDKLESFLQQESPQIVYWICELLERQVNSVTYAELQEAMLNGYEQQIQKWQEDYAKFVNEKLAPIWIAAIRAGAAQLQSKYKDFVFNDSDRNVKDWIRLHTAEFITNIGEDTRAAIKAILAHGQNEGWTAQHMAQAIRPCIGLTRPDAIANARYQQRVYENLLKNTSPENATRQAHEAALRYGAKQHQTRAEMIANTELAFAYNRGYHEGVRQAMAQGLIGACEKVWTTAGSRRVCDKCLALNGQRIGFNESFNISGKELYRGMHQIPPAHPRCRCVIQYVEYLPPARKSSRLGAGEDLPSNTSNSPVILENINVNDPQIVKETIERYERQIVTQPVENAIVIARSDTVFQVVGDLNGVDDVWKLGNNLKGATVLHNHPVGSVNEYSFGNDDLNFFIDAELAVLRGIDEKFVYELTRNANEIDEFISFLELNEFNFRHNEVIRRALFMGIGYRRCEYD